LTPFANHFHSNKNNTRSNLLQRFRKGFHSFYCDLIVKRFLKYRTTTGKDAIIKKNGQTTEEYNG
jgi:hypothetical protein